MCHGARTAAQPLHSAPPHNSHATASWSIVEPHKEAGAQRSHFRLVTCSPVGNVAGNGKRHAVSCHRCYKAVDNISTPSCDLPSESSGHFALPVLPVCPSTHSFARLAPRVVTDGLLRPGPHVGAPADLVAPSPETQKKKSRAFPGVSLRFCFLGILYEHFRSNLIKKILKIWVFRKFRLGNIVLYY